MASSSWSYALYFCWAGLNFLVKKEKGCQVFLTCCCSMAPIAYMEVSVTSVSGTHGSGCTSRVAHDKLTLHSSKDFWSSGTWLNEHCCGPHWLASTYFALPPDQKLIAGLEMCCGRLPHHHLQCSFWAFSASIAILCITPNRQFSPLKMESANSSKTLVMIYQNTRCHIPGDSSLPSYHHENFTILCFSLIIWKCFCW